MANLSMNVFGPNENVDERGILFYIDAIEAFHRCGGEAASEAQTPSIAPAKGFERFAYPVQKGSSWELSYKFDKNLIAQPCATSGGAERSPALATFCKRMGILSVALENGHEKFSLTPLAKAVKSGVITVQEYCFIILGRQALYKDNVYEGKLLAYLGDYLSANGWVFDLTGFKAYVQTVTGANFIPGGNGKDKERWDLLTNALRFAGLLQYRSSGLNAGDLVAPDDAKPIYADIANNKEMISKTPDDTDGIDIYMGSIHTGIIELIKRNGVGVYGVKYPGLLKLANSANLPPQRSTDLVGIVSGVAADLVGTGLCYEKTLLTRFVSALAAKSFVVLTGLSGSGKTKLAQAFNYWLTAKICSPGYDFAVGTEFKSGAYKIVASDSVAYKIYIASTQRHRTIPKTVVNQWIDFYKIHKEVWNEDSQNIKDIIKNLPGPDDNYTHGNDGILANIAKEPFVAELNYLSTGSTSMQLLVPVGADWTNSEKLLGYPNALDKTEYVMPDTGVLKLMMDAEKNPKLPFFLILDEMNLSHVERYFADFLSAMESGDEIKLYDGDQRYGDKEKTIAIPRRIRVPKNLFVIGTMNVDETTYMFSPKVLDRAQVIEFRVKDNEMADFVGHFDAGNNWVPGKATQVDLSKLADANGVGKGAKYAESFLELALKRGEKKPSDQVSTNPGDPVNTIPLREIAKELNRFFPELAKLGTEFGYRSASEIMSFCGYYIDAGATVLDAIDAAIMQKLLPKMHGSQLGLMSTVDILLGYASEQIQVPDPANPGQSKQRDRYPMSKQKLETMKIRLETNGFASFAEA